MSANAEADGWGYIYRKGVYIGALFFDSSNSRKLDTVKSKATVDALGVCKPAIASIVPI